MKLFCVIPLHFIYHPVIFPNLNTTSGLVHLLSGIALAQMVLNCWIGEEFLSLVKALKFLEQAGSNLVAVTNLAICANLALIVHVSIISMIPACAYH